MKHLFVRLDLVYVKPFGYKMKLRIVTMPVIVHVQAVHHMQWIGVCVRVCAYQISRAVTRCFTTECLSG